MTILQSKQKQKKHSSSETAPFDEESNSSLEVGKNKVALVCDWLTTPGGAEKVLLELHHLYPNAPIYTSQYSRRGIDWFNDADVRTGWLQFFPKCLRKFLGPLRQIYFSHLDLTDYDLIISVTGAEAKSVKTKKKSAKPTLSSNYSTHNAKSQEKNSQNPSKSTVHISYCHVPTQYYWQMYDKYIENPGFGILDPLVRLAFKVLVKPLRRADFYAAQQPDQFITISNYAREQIQKYYHRDAIVIPPPVEVSKFVPSNSTAQQERREFLAFFPKSSRECEARTNLVGDERASKTCFTCSEATPKNLSVTKTERDTREDGMANGIEERRGRNEGVSRKTKNCKPKDYFIISCRQVNWKRVDLAIRACQIAKVPLLVIGDGPEHNHLVQLAREADPDSKVSSVSSQNPETTPASTDGLIRFLPWTPTDQLAKYLQGARAYLFPSLEPFGIAAVEALAAGCPVIAYAEGGSRDFIKNGKNGLLFDAQTPESLAAAIQKFQQLSFDRQKVSASALGFSTKHFDESITALVNQFRKDIL